MGRMPLRRRLARDDMNVGKTRPGQSHSVSRSDSISVWKCFVFPGVADTATRLAAQRTLIVELLPTFGYPMNPTYARSASGRSAVRIDQSLNTSALRSGG